MVGWKVLERLYLRKPRPLEFGIWKSETGMRESRDWQIFLLNHPHLHMMKTESRSWIADSLLNSRNKTTKRTRNQILKISAIPNEILNPTPIKSGGRIENNLSSYLLALVEPSRSVPEASVFLLLALDFPMLEKEAKIACRWMKLWSIRPLSPCIRCVCFHV